VGFFFFNVEERVLPSHQYNSNQ